MKKIVKVSLCLVLCVVVLVLPLCSFTSSKIKTDRPFVASAQLVIPYDYGGYHSSFVVGDKLYSSDSTYSFRYNDIYVTGDLRFRCTDYELDWETSTYSLSILPNDFSALSVVGNPLIYCFATNDNYTDLFKFNIIAPSLSISDSSSFVVTVLYTSYSEDLSSSSTSVYTTVLSQLDLGYASSSEVDYITFSSSVLLEPFFSHILPSDTFNMGYISSIVIFPNTSGSGDYIFNASSSEHSYDIFYSGYINTYDSVISHDIDSFLLRLLNLSYKRGVSYGESSASAVWGSVGDFLKTTVGSFMDFVIVGTEAKPIFTIGGFMTVFVSIVCLIWFLKLIAGG